MIINIIFTLIISVLAAVIGALVGIRTKNENKNITNYFIALASGTMIGLLFLEIIPEGIEGLKENYKHGAIYAALIICGCTLIFYLLHELVNKHGHKKNHCHVEGEEDHCHEALHAAKAIGGGRGVIASAIILILAMSIHNLPEGVSVGVAFASSVKSGIILCLVIGIHNLVMSASIAVVLINSNISKNKTIFLTAICFITTILGSVIGYYIGDISEVVLSICLCISSGTLLFVVFYEMLPKAISNCKSKLVYVFLILGIFLFWLITLL